MKCPRLEEVFPKLVDTDYEKTSCADAMYNCIAWAAEDTSRPWWPDASREYAYWPIAVFDTSVATFELAFSTLGYQSCGLDDTIERGFRKVAIFAADGKVQHMARQLPGGEWTSKCGKGEDIRHPLTTLESDTYGRVAIILRRRVG